LRKNHNGEETRHLREEGCEHRVLKSSKKEHLRRGGEETSKKPGKDLAFKKNRGKTTWNFIQN